VARDYRVYVHQEALALLPKTGRRRDSVLRFLANLAQFAHLGEDFEAVDSETGRVVQVTEVSGYAITWWIDGPVREVKVVDITPTGK
jgi:hypothetical protein